jgi:hypothetical protein
MFPAFHEVMAMTDATVPRFVIFFEHHATRCSSSYASIDYIAARARSCFEHDTHIIVKTAGMFHSSSFSRLLRGRLIVEKSSDFRSL